MVIPFNFECSIWLLFSVTERLVFFSFTSLQLLSFLLNGVAQQMSCPGKWKLQIDVFFPMQIRNFSLKCCLVILYKCEWVPPYWNIILRQISGVKSGDGNSSLKTCRQSHCQLKKINPSHTLILKGLQKHCQETRRAMLIQACKDFCPVR